MPMRRMQLHLRCQEDVRLQLHLQCQRGLYADTEGKQADIFLQNEVLHLLGHGQPQRAFRKALLKRFQVKEYIIFSKLIPKELFLIQSLQNPCKTHYTIVRPLINCSRHTITMACFLNRLPVYPDLTNKKVRYSRNRIRKQVIPSLQLFFNPEVEKALFKFSELQAKRA